RPPPAASPAPRRLQPGPSFHRTWLPWPRLIGTRPTHGPQCRGPCPMHRGDGRGRTFSVNLDETVFQCFDARCAKKGDVIHWWATAQGLSLRAAALDLVRTFGLEPAPRGRTEKRHD